MHRRGGVMAAAGLALCGLVALAAAPGRVAAEPPPGDQDDDALLPWMGHWRATTGLRIDQQATPKGESLALGVRLTLPEMSRGALSVETFRWERLDVTEDRSALGEDDGTTYQVLGLRRRFDGALLGAFVGAHVMSWSDGEARGFTPWFGARLGREDGARLEADARLLGVAALDPIPEAGVGDADLTLRASGLPLPRWHLGARARLRDLGHDGGRRRDATAALGVELVRGGRPIFVGLGVQRHQDVPAPGSDYVIQSASTAIVPAPATEDDGITTSTTVLLQIEVDMALPSSLL
ncbi:MAG TPA: hypothetical protein VMZ28_21530 [Kofleriaceae bacterium]|nr:hypothetical protein [Kofleriaceae bacterium]